MKCLVPLGHAFDLNATLNCGQSFIWEGEEATGFWGLVNHTPYFLKQVGQQLEIETTADSTASETEIINSVFHLLGIDDPMEEIKASFPEKDEWLQVAIAFCPGLRLMVQPLWETLGHFILSSQKQVAHIRQMSKKLRMRLGQAIDWKGKCLHAWPTPEVIAHANLEALQACSLGYRAKHLQRTAQLLADGTANLEVWRALSDAKLEEALVGLPGVGPKIAQCVMLYGYGRKKAFPIDVWIQRVLHERYFARRRKKPDAKALKSFAKRHFGPWGGYAQQFLFHHARLTWSEPRSAKKQVSR